MTEINHDTEMKFAREFYKKAVIGLSPQEYPPYPDQWVLSEEYTRGWEGSKVEMIGMLESEESELTDEQKEHLEMFLKCDLCIYLDLMSSIYDNFYVDSSSIENSDDTDEETDENPINDEPLITTEPVEEEKVVISTKEPKVIKIEKIN